MKRSWRVLSAFIKINVQSAMAYRLGGLLWVTNSSIPMIISLIVWDSISPSGSQMPLYFLGVIVVHRLTQTWSLGEISDKIVDGSLSLVLIRPYHFVLEIISSDVGQKINRIIVMIPMMLVLGSIFRPEIKFTVLHLILGLLAACLGYFINLGINSCLGLLSCWTGSSESLAKTWEMIVGLTAGYLIPIIFMPLPLRMVLEWLPIRYLVSFPMELILNQLTPTQILQGFIVGLAWIIVLFIIFRVIDRQSMKYFSAFGG